MSPLQGTAMKNGGCMNVNMNMNMNTNVSGVSGGGLGEGVLDVSVQVMGERSMRKLGTVRGVRVLFTTGVNHVV